MAENVNLRAVELSALVSQSGATPQIKAVELSALVSQSGATPQIKAVELVALVAIPPQTNVYYWDGVDELPATISLWDGAAEIPATAEVV